MRSPSNPGPAISTQLDTVLGTPAGIRVLRTLFLSPGERLSASQVARLSGLTPAGAGRALVSRTEAGVVRREGDGRYVRYLPDERHPLHGILAVLFREEAAVAERLEEDIRTALTARGATAGWLDDSSASVADPIRVEVLVTGRYDPTEVLAMERDIDTIAGAAGRRVEMRMASILPEDRPPEGWRHIMGVDTRNLPMPRGRVPASIEESHGLSSIRGQAMATLVRKHPSLPGRARDYVASFLEQQPQHATMLEWLGILDSYSDSMVAELLASGSERSERLRLSSPFWLVLGSEEREELYGVLETLDTKETP